MFRFGKKNKVGAEVGTKLESPTDQEVRDVTAFDEAFASMQLRVAQLEEEMGEIFHNDFKGGDEITVPKFVRNLRATFETRFVKLENMMKQVKSNLRENTEDMDRRNARKRARMLREQQGPASDSDDEGAEGTRGAAGPLALGDSGAKGKVGVSSKPKFSKAPAKQSINATADADKKIRFYVSNRPVVLYPPTNFKKPKDVNEKPDEKLQLDWVYGYRGFDCRANVVWNKDKELVYFAAGVGIVYSLLHHKQRYFMGHDDDIKCLAMHPDLDIVATGQLGRHPRFCVWSSSSMKLLFENNDFHRIEVSALSFNKKGDLLVTVGGDDFHRIGIFDWKRGIRIAEANRGDAYKIYAAKFNPYDNQLVSVGVKHIKFWTQDGKTLKGRNGIFGTVGIKQKIMCLDFPQAGHTLTGTYSGDIYLWEGNNCVRVFPKHHEGPIFGIDIQRSGNFFTSGTNAVLLWKHQGDMLYEMDGVKLDIRKLAHRSKTPELDGTPAIRALDVNNDDDIVVGLSTNEIYMQKKDSNKVMAVMQGHAEGELWGCDTHPEDPKRCVTASDDKSVRVWDLENHVMVKKSAVKSQGRAVAFHPSGGQFAVGRENGGVTIFSFPKMEKIHTMRDRKEWISELEYSPNGKYLAVGSHDNFIDIYDTERDFKRVGICKGHSSYITHVDWSKDGTRIQTNSGDYEILYWEMPSGTLQRYPAKERDTEWNTWSSVLGFPVQGIWPPGSDGTDVNNTARSNNGKLLATADDFGKVKIFRWPSVSTEQQFREYTGHCSHVTNVRWTCDDKYIISTGGHDTTVMQWKVRRPKA